ncbi:BZ3500_MvSof-1268-A1-R1_Chr3-1g05702 [Microbotryum saponariae]|uniref:BZ3500_MvSof-1268-A1-R1_Chr3-1g05702 protein n=1 Tax=Microbotryum saponariae TaxID=289078 RepID=A0A2X0MWK5_9BASI|nr:BZ3500_MvSof-1268-A1-R1_Chr3-1g05702 [Microbotryum saponariae]SDA04892.1 BZ3501_MvSof-1269-A2-R1_Chr3-1g05372 [Microbotryum saponariae]
MPHAQACPGAQDLSGSNDSLAYPSSRPVGDQEGGDRTIEIFTGMVLEMISGGRWRMQMSGTRMESV